MTRKRIFSISFLLSVMLVVFSISPISAMFTQLLYDDFNDLNIGDAPLSEKGWSFNSSNGYVYAVNSPAIDGKSLYIYQSNRYYYVQAKNDFTDNGKIIVEFNWYVGTVSNQTFYIISNNTSNRHAIMLRNIGGTLKSYNQQIVQYESVGLLQQDNWNHIKIIADNSKSKYTIFLNGIDCEMDYRFPPAGADFIELYFQMLQNYTGSQYIDNISIYGWLPNQSPVANANGPYTSDYGSTITFNSSGSSDPDGTITSYAWDLDGDGEYDDATGVDPPWTWYDDFSGTIGLEVTDDQGATSQDATAITVNNIDPIITDLTLPIDPVNISDNVSLSGAFTDLGILDEHTVVIDWGDGVTTAGTVDEAEGTITGDHTYAEPGVYIVALTITDDDGGSDTCTFKHVIVYDPKGGFVTGGGWFNSPSGAYTPDDLGDPDLVGKATFGFVSKYKKGASVPTGNTQFQFKAGDLNFNSTSYQWLVVNQDETNAQYKGSGTVNGSGDYKFMIWAGDGDVDTFRIKIWEEDEQENEIILYDNGSNQPIDGGSVVIHTVKVKK